MKIIFALLFPFLLNSEIIINGFGSITLSNSDSKNDTHMLYIDQKQTIDTGIDFKSGSVFGLQGTIEDDEFSIIGQTIFRENLNKKIYEPQLEWLFVKTYIADDLELFAGRLRTPVYFFSDSLYVDYTRDSIKLPMELYGSAPFSYYDGIELLYSFEIDENYFIILLGYSGMDSTHIVGQIEENNTPLEVIRADAKLISISLEKENLFLRATYINSKMTLNNEDANKLFDLFDKIGFSGVSDDYKLDNKESEIYTIGFKYYCLDDITLSGEWLKRISKSFLPDISSYYLMASYNINSKWTPFVSYAHLNNIQKTDSRLENYDNKIIKDSIFYFLDKYSVLNGEDLSETSYSLGAKYYASEYINIKLEVKQKIIHIDEIFNMYHLSLDFVF